MIKPSDAAWPTSERKILSAPETFHARRADSPAEMDVELSSRFVCGASGTALDPTGRIAITTKATKNFICLVQAGAQRFEKHGRVLRGKICDRRLSTAF